MREVVIDTETTGLNYKAGDRVIEVGCVELVNHVATNQSLQFYCKVDKDISDSAKKNLKAFHYKTYHRVYERLIEELGDNDIVMIKGSNSINLSKICERLKKK